jgi:hypothetical protein
MITHGYQSKSYGLSYSQLGEILTLPSSGIQVLTRRIDEKSFDVTGLYPYVVTNNWSELSHDLDFLKDLGAVSLVFVSDPFSDDAVPSAMQDWTLCKPFKVHHTVELRENWRENLNQNYRNYVRRALKLQQVIVIQASNASPDQFYSLYQNLVAHRAVTGLQTMSHEIITRQLTVPGGLVFSARAGDEILGELLVYGDGKTAHAHLMGISPQGYKLHTSYGLFGTMLDYLEKSDYSRVNIGGTSGDHDTKDDGLSRFKQRWANNQHSAYLCGQVINQSEYDRLVEEQGARHSDFFPAYRTPG